MKKFILIIVSLIITFSSITLFSSEKAYAEPMPTKDIQTPTNANQNFNSINFMFNNDLKSVGVARSQSFSFYIQKNWKPKDSFLNLIFTQSQLTLSDQSTLTVQVNGISIYSIRLAGKNNYNEQIKVPIRGELLKSGDNIITIETHRRISNDLCADDSNTANWIEFSKDSYVHLNYSNKGSRFNLNEFPYPFIDNTILNSTINVVTPKNPTSSTLSAAMELSSYLGNYGGDANTKVNFTTYDSIDDFKNKNIIFIANENNLPTDISSLLTKEELEAIKNETLIKNIANPVSPNYNILLIIGSDSTINEAVKFLYNPTLLEQANQNSIFINSSLNVDDIQNDSKEGDLLSFKDLGYGNVILRGPLLQTANYNFSIPPNKLVQNGATLNLKFRYAKDLDFNRSLITAYINNIPIGSKNLTEANADNDSVTFSIPKDITQSNNYNVRIEFNLAINAKECTARDDKNPWAFISNESYVSLPTSNRDYYSFNNYPYPFVENNKLNNILFVLPNDLSNNNLTIAANIMSYIGRYSKYNNGNIKVITANNFNNSMSNYNIIMLGTPANNTAIKDINNSLYLKFNKDFTGYELNNPKIQLLPNYSENITTLQLLKSPFNSSKGLLVISSPKEEDLNLASDILNNSKDIYKLKDNVSILDNDGNVINYSFDLPQDKIEANKTKKYNINMSIVVFIIMLIIIFIIIGLLFRKKFKKYK
ncbi:cellulose biosynthesis cyclic di-GMP-binding regulatory protein BcsB [Clostridium massiliamazoniense]|uniref:cellulose biosynthesis cyclic di-GMP-binding regulatory protein BcsB n=1 Tax=Clostridium massiliamazoniense TaxID=1347366 RepID=UPI0006D7B095|nr:cellulose biosynthesis cyclic di-GMP-binding regulatory protein BcsB [Clostridium massiliamazoniense]